MHSAQHLYLHHCEKHNHYHLITGHEDISWPFWSLEAGLKLVELTKEFFRPDNPEKGEAFQADLIKVREQILERSRVQNTDARGRFAKGFRMPRNFMPGEDDVARCWQEFRNGKVPHAGYIAHEPFGTFFLPLFCDFVTRNAQVTFPMNRTQLARVAEAPARVVTMEELGIVLEAA